MDIKNRQALKQAASDALSSAPNEKKLITCYTGVTIGLGILFTIADTLLGKAASGGGGLSDLGRSTLLQTFQSLLPVVQLVFTILWTKGYLRSMMYIGRGQNADLQTVTQTFRLFGPIFRLEMLVGLIFGGILFGCTYLGTYLYMFSPFGLPLVEQLNASGSMLSGEMMITDAATAAIMEHMLPMLGITMALCAIVALPLFYSYRMASYCLLDDPRAGARASLRWSKAMMRNRRMELFKLDLSLWWYYALEAGALVISYIPMILSLLGIRRPMSDTVSGYLFLGIYYVLIFLIHVKLRNYCEVIYVKAYDRLRTPDEPPQPVILGNIFQM